MYFLKHVNMIVCWSIEDQSIFFCLLKICLSVRYDRLLACDRYLNLIWFWSLVVISIPHKQKFPKVALKMTQYASLWKILTWRFGPGSSVGIATDYGLEGPGSNPGGDDIFRNFQTGPEVHPAFRKMGTVSFPGVECGRVVLLTTHLLLEPRSWKSRAIPLPILWAKSGR